MGKRTETKEKLVLPGEEDIKTEKTIQGLIMGVEGFENDKLKTVKTREPASASAVMKIELARDSSLTAVAGFENDKLKTVKTREPASASAVMKIELARDSSLTA